MNEQPIQLRHPPLEESVFGVQFEPLPKFRTAHFGLFWARIRERYPLTEDQPPLPPQSEPAELLQPTGGLISFQTMPFVPRCWFLDHEGTHILQVQHNRILRNWRRITGAENYPGFDALLPQFQRDWADFGAFVAEQGLGNLNVNQCELTYVNQIEKGAGWQDFSDLAKVFSLFCEGKSGGTLPMPELFNWDAKYKLPADRGRLHVTMNPVLRGRDFKVVLSLNLTARGGPGGPGAEDVIGWFHLAHEWVLNAFRELTRERMHELWGKQT
jgi:uncharacterized protein (TIGR04255 family)